MQTEEWRGEARVQLVHPNLLTLTLTLTRYLETESSDLVDQSGHVEESAHKRVGVHDHRTEADHRDDARANLQRRPAWLRLALEPPRAD